MCLLVLIVTFGIASATNCPSGFEAHGGSCYFFSHGGETWMGAYESCKDIMKAHLVEVNDEPENAYLSNKTASLGGYWWIGLSDKVIEGKYVWESSFSPLMPGDYSNWGSNEPHGVGANHDENCVVYAHKKWADVNCDRIEHYICETIAGENIVVG